MKLTTKNGYSRCLVVSDLPERIADLRNPLATLEITINYAHVANEGQALPKAIALDNHVIPEIVAAVNGRVPDLTEVEESRRGRLVAELIGLKRDESYPDRWLTDCGNKTDLGLYRTLRRFIVEGV